MQNLNTKDVLERLISLTSERDSNSLEISLAQTLFDLVSPGAIVIYRVQHQAKQLFTVTSLGDDAIAKEISPNLQVALRECIETGVPVEFIDDNSVRLRLYPLKGVKSQILGVLAVAMVSGMEHQDEVTEMLLQIYQNFINLINDNERDTLTGLLNRKTFEVKINKVLALKHSKLQRKEDEAPRQHYLAIFDIDHFKRVNDNFGHLIGDEVLLMFSQLMTSTFREHDLLFRFGGEEFVGVFECDSLHDVEMILNRFREKVGAHNFPQVGNVTVSSGFTLIAEFDASAQIIDRADLALYHAKNNGRNRVCHYESLLEAGEIKESNNVGDIELF